MGFQQREEELLGVTLRQFRLLRPVIIHVARYVVQACGYVWPDGSVAGLVPAGRGPSAGALRRAVGVRVAPEAHPEALVPLVDGGDEFG